MHLSHPFIPVLSVSVPSLNTELSTIGGVIKISGLIDEMSTGCLLSKY